MVESRGHLNPGSADVVFDRFELGLDELVRHVWVVRWSVPPGQVRPQRVLTYPAFNVVFDPQGVALYGPDRKATTRELSGDSWVVGVLLRPAAAPVLTTTPPGQLVGGAEPITHAPHAAVAAAMRGRADEREAVAAVLRGWLAPLAERIAEAGRLVNRAQRLVEERHSLVRSADLAAELGVSRRSLERLVKEHIGVSPKWLIECRRLQYAATTLYTAPNTTLTDLAAELGYADQAHFTRRYHQVLGETPDDTRKAGQARRTPAR